MLFPEIYNLKNFLTDHPNYHPASQDYISYWREQKKRCIEGFWAEDYPKDGEVAYRYMPGYLYFYGNLSTIKVVDAETKSTVISRPRVDDVEWIFFTVFLVCRGFSGFEKDEEFTCIIEPERRDPNKTFVEPWEYLKRTHSKPLGRALFNNQALNLLWLSSRGIGKTYSVGAGIITAEILFDGAKVYNEKTINNPASITIFVGAYKGDKSTNLLVAMDDAIANLPGSYGDGDSRTVSPFYKELTGVNKPGNIRQHIYKVKENGDWVSKGTKSKIVHEVITVANPQSPAAYRATLAIIEEIGLLEANLDEVLGATNPVLKVGNQKFGSLIGIGTGGNIEKAQQLEPIFRNPKEYNFFSMYDIFENTGDIGLFIPVHYMFREYKDKNGNTKWDIVNEVIKNTRKKLKYKALEQERMNYPVVPSEIFMNNKGSIFPLIEINEQLKWVIANEKKIQKFTSVGDLVYTEEGLKFKADENAIPINKFPLEKGADLTGSIVIYEHPPEYIPENLYKIVYDPVRDENIDKMDQGISLAAIYVYKAINTYQDMKDSLVASYVGRLRNTDQIHEIALKLALYYNAKIMVEMDLPGFYKYCLQRKRLNLLAKTPVVMINKFNANAKFRYSYGVMMKGNSALKIQAEQYLADWLLKEQELVRDEEGNVVKVVKNINRIYDKALLEELRIYNRTGNFDRVSSLLLLMIWIQETFQEVINVNGEEQEDRFSVFFAKYFK